MSSLPIPKWHTASLFADQSSFRAWLRGATSPNGDGLGTAGRKLHRLVAPLAIQTELGRGCNAMLLDALSAGSDHLTERMAVVSARIFDCMECAADTRLELVQSLSGPCITPVDGEDLFRLSRLLVRGIEQLAGVATGAAGSGGSERELCAVHQAIAESFGILANALPHLGDRNHGHGSYVRLSAEYGLAKASSRLYFARLMSSASSADRILAVLSARRRYDQLISHLSTTADALFHTALKNG